MIYVYDENARRTKVTSIPLSPTGRSIFEKIEALASHGTAWYGRTPDGGHELVMYYEVGDGQRFFNTTITWGKGTGHATTLPWYDCGE